MVWNAGVWTIKKGCSQKISVVKMYMVRWMCSNTKRARLRNENILTRVGVAPIEEKIQEKCL